MITTVDGDAVQALREGSIDVLVHQVNLDGAMGAGIARQIARTWPAIVPAYHHALATHALTLGRMQTIAEESNARCGRCGRSSRINYSAPRYNLRLNISGIDQGAEFSEWSLSDLRDRVALIQDFDQLADDLRTEFLYVLDTYCVITQDILVPQTVTLLQECTGS